MSGAVYLEAGKQYFFEVIQQHGHGREAHVSLAWSEPGENVREPIPKDRLRSFVPDERDLDNDWLPDDWEKRCGLNPEDNGLIGRFTEGERGDFDGDGLTNLEEFQLRTHPAQVDTDGDGLSDSAEVWTHHTDPTQAGAIPDTLVASLDLASGDSDTTWTEIGNGIVADTFRGNVAFDFEAPRAGRWIVEIRGELMGDLRFAEALEVGVRIDGIDQGEQTLTTSFGVEGRVSVLSHWLERGKHRVALEINNVLARRTLRITAVEIRVPSGIDADENGEVDWMTRELGRNGFANQANISNVSPFFAEGSSRLPASASSAGAALLPGRDSYHWYGDFPLSADGRTPVKVDFDADRVYVSKSVEWVPVNVLGRAVIALRSGDTLRLNAWSEATPREAAKITIGDHGVFDAGPGNDVFFTFEQAGRVVVEAATGSGQSGSLVVEVFDGSFGEMAYAAHNRVRWWDLPGLPHELTLEPSTGLRIGVHDRLPGGGTRLRLIPDKAGLQAVLARIHPNGPVVDRGVVLVSQHAGAFAGEYQVETASLFDGYKLITAPLVITNFPPGGRADVTIFRAGVTFVDGTRKKILTEADFVNGMVLLEFLFPVEMAGGYCHYTELFDGQGKRISRL